MKKVIAFTMAIIITLSFSSCASSSDEIFTASNGSDYIVVRDADGNIVINDSGKLQVYALNENNKKQKSDAGEYITEYIEFDGQLVLGRIVETAEMRYEIPNNFTADSDNPGYFYYEPYEGEIFFTYYNGDVKKYIDAAESNCESLLESYGSESFEYEVYTVKIGDLECTAFRQSCTSSEYYKNSFNYYIPYDTGVYIINCIISTDSAGKVDFDKFAESIVLK